MTITIQPAAKTALACTTNPDLWLSDDPTDRAVAVHICKSHCPFLAKCKTYPPTASAVQAGIFYGVHGEPVGRQPDPAAANCDDCGGEKPAGPPPTSTFDDCGEYKGYRRHKRGGERACEPCADANRRRERERQRRRRQHGDSNPCGSIRGLMRHREAGEPPCSDCVAAQRRAIDAATRARVGDPDVLAAKVPRIRELAGQGLSDREIGVEVGLSKPQVLRLRTANGITSGVPAYRTRVAA